MVVYTPVIPALQRQRQAGLAEYKASLVYTVSSRKARARPILKKEGGGRKRNTACFPFWMTQSILPAVFCAHQTDPN